MSPAELRPGMSLEWRAVVSNWGHVSGVPVSVVSVGPKRVRVETRYNDGKPERRVNVKAENLFMKREVR